MLNQALPYFLEDRTGLLSKTHYEDLYDRLFLSVSASSSSVLTISNTGRRATCHEKPARWPSQRDREPSAVLEFGARGALGTISFSATKESLPMAQWLKKTSLFSGYVSHFPTYIFHHDRFFSGFRSVI